VQLLGRLIEFAFGSNLYKATRPGSGTWYPRVLAWLDSILGLSHTVSDHDLPDCYWRTLVGDYDIVTSRFPTNRAQIELCRTLRRSLDLLCKQVAPTGSSSPTIPPLIELVMEKDLQFNFENHWTHLDRIWSARTFLYNGWGAYWVCLGSIGRPGVHPLWQSKHLHSPSKPPVRMSTNSSMTDSRSGLWMARPSTSLKRD
jgi:hypothetical protein